MCSLASPGRYHDRTRFLSSCIAASQIRSPALKESGTPIGLADVAFDAPAMVQARLATRGREGVRIYTKLNPQSQLPLPEPCSSQRSSQMQDAYDSCIAKRLGRHLGARRLPVGDPFWAPPMKGRGKQNGGYPKRLSVWGASRLGVSLNH